MFSLKHEFPSEWYRFLHPVDEQSMPFNLAMERFPFQFRGKKIEISQVDLFLKFKEIHDADTYKSNGSPLGDYADAPLKLNLTPPLPGAMASNTLLTNQALLSGLPFAPFDFASQSPPPGVGGWTLEASQDDIKKITQTLQKTVKISGAEYHHLKSDVIDDIVMVCHYSAS
jgi:hypothetical protein